MVSRDSRSAASLCALAALVFNGCYLFGDDAHEEVSLVKGFYMNWFIDPVDRHIILSSDEPRSGVLVVQSTVVATGFNNDFIIAMQHPNLSDTISARLFHRDSISGDFELMDPADSVYLWEGDSVYQRNGRWYHISNGSAIPDSLRPYGGITNYFVIDLRAFEEGDRDGYKVHQAVGDTAFHSLRSALGVPEHLRFTVMDSTLR